MLQIPAPHERKEGFCHVGTLMAFPRLMSEKLASVIESKVDLKPCLNLPIGPLGYTGQKN